MGEWRECTLGDVIELKRGYDLPKQAREPGLVPIVSSSGITDQHSEKKVDSPGVVTGRYGTLGQVFYIEKDFWPLNTTLYVRNFKGNDPRFISYFLRGINFLAYSDKAAVPGLNRNHLHHAQVRIPTDSGEQRSIASILSSLDDKIELNQRMNETLEGIARAIFRDWFVDFGPTRSKMDGREPYLAPGLWALFPDRLDDDGTPEGWETQRVEDTLQLVYGKALRASDRIPGPIPVYGSGGITGFHNEALTVAPSIIVGRKGTVGSLYWEDEPFFPIDTVFYVKPKAPLSFCFYLLQSLGLDSMNTDAAVPGLNRNNVYRLSAPNTQNRLPSEFDKIVGALRQKTRANNSETRTLAAIRDLLLPRLMSGEIRVAEAQKQAEQTLQDGAPAFEAGASP